MQQMHHTNLHPSSFINPWQYTPLPNLTQPPHGPFGAYEQLGNPSMMGHMVTPEIFAASQGLSGLDFPNPLYNPLHLGYPHSLGSRLDHQAESDQPELPDEEPEKKKRR